MLNKVILIGNLTKDPEAKNTQSGNTVCTFNIAVSRKFKDANGDRQTDFINCVAWRQTANFISSYFHKGSKIAIVGSIQTRTYDDKDGKKVYVTEVVVDDAEFVESAKTSQTTQAAPTKPKSNEGSESNEDLYPDGFMDEDNATIEF